jgi:hypothetical protein
MRGRKPLINKQIEDIAYRLFAQGKTEEQVADILGVAVSTLDKWKQRYPQFLQALKEAKETPDDIVEASLFQRATGYTHTEEKIFCSFGQVIRVKVQKHYPPDVTAQIFWLKNRRPEKWRLQELAPPDPNEVKQVASDKVDFKTFCERARYPVPFEKQINMRDFAFEETDPRMILGARGYGKTDYVTILGTAYSVYLHGNAFTALIITKSKSRNTAIVNEIATVLKLNGVGLDKENASCVRIAGLTGKDHSVEAITIKTSMRGRHPKVVIMDDPVTEEDISEAMRVLVKRKYNEVMKLCSNVVVIGQPAHKYDLYAELRPMVKSLELPFGEIPELDHDLEAQRLAGVDESSIQASYFLNVVSEEVSPFEKCGYIDGFPTGDSVAFIDPSFEGGDYTAISIVRAYLQGVAVVGFIYKKAWNDCLPEMVARMHEFNVKKLCFETNSLGTMPIDILNQALGGSIAITGKKSNTNKHARISSAGIYAHMIHLSKKSDRKYIDQVVKYEYKAKHDDAPDSLASCLEWIGLIRGKI